VLSPARILLRGGWQREGRRSERRARWLAPTPPGSFPFCDPTRKTRVVSAQTADAVLFLLEAIFWNPQIKGRLWEAASDRLRTLEPTLSHQSGGKRQTRPPELGSECQPTK